MESSVELKGQLEKKKDFHPGNWMYSNCTAEYLEVLEKAIWAIEYNSSHTAQIPNKVFLAGIYS